MPFLVELDLSLRPFVVKSKAIFSQIEPVGYAMCIVIFTCLVMNAMFWHSASCLTSFALAERAGIHGGCENSQIERDG
jgi:hypothetical protein